MPRYGTVGGAIPETGANARTAAIGHDVVHVCAFCADLLQSELQVLF